MCVYIPISDQTPGKGSKETDNGIQSRHQRQDKRQFGLHWLDLAHFLVDGAARTIGLQIVVVLVAECILSEAGQRDFDKAAGAVGGEDEGAEEGDEGGVVVGFGYLDAGDGGD